MQRQAYAGLALGFALEPAKNFVKGATVRRSVP
jgi:hypothetical protein